MKLVLFIQGLIFAATCIAEDHSLQLRQSNWTVGQTVQTDSGPVNGHAAANATAVSEYLGIPFAKPPVGDLRFAPPQKYTSNSTVNGTNFVRKPPETSGLKLTILTQGFSCPADLSQYTGGNASTIASANLTTFGLLFLELLAQVGDHFSEDCLTLNVWTKPQTGDARKAVLLWIYGGGFTTGNSDNVGYNGQYLADSEDVVLVTIK
jgi:cholinesterase